MILAILQARMSSSRLPGKVLKPILGKPMLALQIERILRSKKIDKLVLATSADESDQPLEDLAKSLGVSCYRGNLNNVLERFYKAAEIYNSEHIVRLTGDCPAIDPALIDSLITYYLKNNLDYAGLEPSYPDGLDVEVMRWKALGDAYHEAQLPSEKEHVTLFINKRPDRYRLGSIKNKIDYSQLRWTVDEHKDFELITKIYESLYVRNPHFSWEDILEFVESNPVLKTYNTEHKRNEGLVKSLLQDQVFLKGLVE